jgi:electron transfer flavoprotein beta subunit
MKICVLIKQVPDTDSVIKISGDNITIVREGLTYATNESDSYALEEALLLKEKHGGEVIVCTLGEEGAVQVIKDGLAKGADKGLQIAESGYEHSDPLTIAKIFATTLKDEGFDLILSGIQSDDSGNAQVGVLLAELMSISHSSLVVGTEMMGDSVIKVKRELEGGWAQYAELDLPASLTIQSGLNKPRYASLRGIMMMKKKPIATKTIGDIGIENIHSECNIKQFYIPEKTKETLFIEGSPDEIVNTLVEKLANNIKVI